MAVGDAAHALTPQLGLGTTLAVQDAIALSEAVHRHGAVAGALVYERARKSPVRAYQTLSRLLTPFFQANGWAWPRDVAFSGGRYLPGVAWVMKRSLAY
ncbi:FAD-dependent oxidoreductase [Burkholderia cenocepacia]|uniref:FAD-dependent oxidoreductase n=1 Tax=Burkholderia cenocepacia TaxID=95486 RepID=UPI001F3B2A75|nr:FAD-dependent monooxygenase [Burkholderia cenocepacia]